MKPSKGRYGIYFRAARKQAGMSQLELAQILNLSQSCVSKIEAGQLEPSAGAFLMVRRIIARSRAQRRVSRALRIA